MYIISKGKGLTDYHRSRPSRDTLYEREMSTATQPSSLGLTTTRATLQQQGGLGDSATFASNTASRRHDPYKGPSAQPQRPYADKHSAHKLERMEHDLLGVGSHTFDSGNIQHRSHAAYLEPFRCPHHCHTSQESLMSLGSGQGLSPMDRFRAEGLSERNAILPRPDALDKSMYKCHQCNKTVQGCNGVIEDSMGA